jgi:hypothetical protein
MPDLCYRCFAQGHECVAHDVDPENNRPICAFCADGEPCPIAKRQQRVAAAPPAAAVDPDKLPEITDEDIEDDAVSALRNQGYGAKQARNAVLAAVSQHGAQNLAALIQAASAIAVTTNKAPAPTHTQEKNEMATRKCAWPDCNEAAKGEALFCSPRCYQRDYAKRKKAENDATASRSVSKATPPRKSAAKAVTPAPEKSNGHAITVDTDADLANICVTSDQLNDWFSARSIADRAAIFQHWLNGHIGVTA